MTDAARQLISYLHRGGTWAYWWTMEGKQSTWWKVGEPAAIPKGHKNVYFGVHPTATIPERNPRGDPAESRAVRAQLPYLAALNCLYAEFDAKDYGGDKNATLQAVETFDPPPSVVVDSGGGYHCYWLFDEPYTLDAPETREHARKLQAAWVTYAGSDPQVKDLARVLRVPGTTNYKYEPPRPVEVIKADYTLLYTPDTLEGFCAHLFEQTDLPKASADGNTSESRYAQRALDGEVAAVLRAPEHQKHDTIRNAALKLGTFVPLGLLDENDIIDQLTHAANLHRTDVEDTYRTVLDGLAYGKMHPRKIPPAKNTEYVVKSKEETTESALILDKLHMLGYNFRLNLCSDSVEVNGRKISDIVAAKIRMNLRDIGLGKKLAAAEDAYMAEAEKNAYHPIRDYINGLTWDEGDYISELAGYMQSDDPPILYSDGTTVPLHGVYLYRWLIGAIAKALDAQQNAMLVLDGPQGIGKSTFARWLCSGIPDYFIEGPIATADKDTDVRLIDKWIWEVSELDATTRKQDQSAIKAFVTKREVTVRKSYGRHDITKPALASLVGTVNNTSGFLADESGSRRFFITRIEHIDLDYQKIDVNQLWAQAAALFREGERWQLVGEEKQAQNARNEGYEVESVLDDWLDKYFTFDPAYDDPISLADIIGELLRADIRVSGSERGQAMELARILTRKGARKVETRNGKRWLGLFRKMT